jgi:hypothetical protein
MAVGQQDAVLIRSPADHACLQHMFHLGIKFLPLNEDLYFLYEVFTLERRFALFV